MFKTLMVPIRVRTAHGEGFAHYLRVPTQAGEPWWMVYRAENGCWFTAIISDEEVAPGPV